MSIAEVKSEEELVQRMVFLYDVKKMSLGAVAQELNSTKTTVQRKVKKFVKLRTSSEAQLLRPRTKKKRLSPRKNGCNYPSEIILDHYHNRRLIRLSTSDPFYCMVDAKGMVPESRYVMAQHLNRPLTLNDKIFHKDGNKLNCAIENLKLKSANIPLVPKMVNRDGRLSADAILLINDNYREIERYLSAILIKRYGNNKLLLDVISHLATATIEFEPEKGNFVRYAATKCLFRWQDEQRLFSPVSRTIQKQKNLMEAIEESLISEKGFCELIDIEKKLNEQISSEGKRKSILKYGRVNNFVYIFTDFFTFFSKTDKVKKEREGEDVDSLPSAPPESPDTFREWHRLDWEDMIKNIESRIRIRYQDQFVSKCKMYLADILLKILNESIYPECLGEEYKTYIGIARELDVSGSYISLLIRTFLREECSEIFPELLPDEKTPCMPK